MAHQRSRFGKKIDSVHWTGFFEEFKDLTAGTAAKTAIPAQHLPETLLRMRGEWAATLDAGLASGVGIFVCAGMIQVPEGTGTTVLWSPLTDADAPWIWWDTFQLVYIEYVADVVASTQLANRARVIDSKAMRKLRNAELQLVVENATVTGFSAGTVQVAASGRALAGS